jgi:T-complex protein 1 subunit delta
MMNIEAAKAVADAVRTSLGPRGMDKMVAQADGEVIITNDGATILQKMRVEQPAAKMMVELSKSQDVVAGDGTTSVVVLCGALLRKSLDLLQRGIHATTVSDAFDHACQEAVAILERDVAVPVAVDDRASLLKAANTSLSSKIVSQHSSLLSPMAVDCLLQVVDPARPEFLDLKDIRVRAPGHRAPPARPPPPPPPPGPQNVQIFAAAPAYCADRPVAARRWCARWAAPSTTRRWWTAW